jgi:hypothetical protein
MANYDVFNGDTDGIFGWHQLRLAHPRDATLVTGVKRDVGLVGRVEAGEYVVIGHYFVNQPGKFPICLSSRKARVLPISS